MRNTVVLIAIVLFGCACMIGQSAGSAVVSDDNMVMQLPVPPPPPPPDGGAAPPNVFFHTQHSGDKVTMTYVAVGDSDKTVTGAPYTATATTETTQVLADGNRIVNKSESQLARDGQGRTRRQEVTGNVGPLATNAPKMAFINDPVANATYILDLNDKTAQVLKVPAGVRGLPEMQGVGKGAGTGAGSGPGPVMFRKKVIVAGGSPGVEQRVWVNSNEDGEAKTESLGTQTIEGVPATGTRTTRTIPAGEIGNERPIEITSEVWTSTDLQMVVMSKRNDPRIGETVYKLTNIQRAEPDPSLFQVPSGFSVNQESGVRTKGE